MFVIWLIFKGNNLKLLFLCILIFCIFSVTSKWIDKNNQTSLTGEESTFTGEIASPPKIDGNQISFIYKLSSNEKVQLFYYTKTQTEKDSLSKLKVGMDCKLKGSLNVPSKATNEYAFNYLHYLYKRHIHWVLSPVESALTSCVTPTLHHYALERWRTSQLEFIKQNFPEISIGIVQALIFGERSEISRSVEMHFQAFGIIHLLAISGLHVSLIITVVFYCLIRVGISREKSFLILILMLPIYMVISGAAPSVIRACLVTMFVLLSLRFSAVIVPIDALSIAYLLMLFFNPYYVTDVGFQLSFLVSFSLIVSSQSILSHYKNRFVQVLIVTSIAQISSLPIMYYYFYEISILSLPLNVFMVPLVSVVILPLSFLSYFSYLLFEPLGVVLGYLLSKLLSFIYFLLEYAYSSFTLTLTFGRPPLWIVLAYCAAIIFLFKTWEQRSKLILSIGMLVTTLLVHSGLPYLSNSGYITMIDVGQGDSILIELPYRKAVYLIDTGGTLNFNKEKWEQREVESNVGRDVIVPYLKAKGIRSLDKLIITHGDLDHIGGALAILQSSVNVHELVVGEGKTEDEAADEVYTEAIKKKIPITKVKAGDKWSIDKYKFYVLGPSGGEESENNRSIVLYSILGGYKWLFTGDLELEGEQQLLDRFPKLRADILKIGHHGSKTSTSAQLLETLKPKLALISVGKSNRFGHPHNEVISLLLKNRIRVLRTDQHGTITYKFIVNKGTFKWMFPYNDDIR